MGGCFVMLGPFVMFDRPVNSDMILFKSSPWHRHFEHSHTHFEPSAPLSALQVAFFAHLLPQLWDLPFRYVFLFFLFLMWAWRFGTSYLSGRIWRESPPPSHQPLQAPKCLCRPSVCWPDSLVPDHLLSYRLLAKSSSPSTPFHFWTSVLLYYLPVESGRRNFWGGHKSSRAPWISGLK